MDAERGPYERAGKEHPPTIRSTYAVPRWLAWLAGIVMLILLILAITLPLTINKKNDKNDENPASSLIPFHDMFSSDPFDKLEGAKRVGLSSEKVDVDRLRSIWEKLSFEDRLGQLSQWSKGDYSGPQIIDDSDESWYKLIESGKVGSFINVVNIYSINLFQQKAKDAGKPPVLFGFDVIHGYATVFPHNIGMAAAFDRKMIYDYATIAAKEQLLDGITWTFAPMVDIARDPRWGRMAEGAGEDPYLTGELGVQYVKGFQDNGVAACVKHLVAYGGAQAGREYSTAELSDGSLFNDYLPPYKKAVQAGVLSSMAALNTIKGIPAHANREMLVDVLRGMWRFEGVVDSDYGAIRELVNHGVAADVPDAAVLALRSGVELAMGDGAFLSEIDTYVGRGDHSWDDKLEDGHTLKEHVELAAKRIMVMKEMLGLFDNDGIFDDSHHGDGFRLPEYLEAAKSAAEKSAVLLKNKAKTLPISEKAGKILLVGKLADSKVDQIGNWSGVGRNISLINGVPGPMTIEGVTTPYESFLAKFPSADDPKKPDEKKFAFVEGYTTTLWTETWEEDDAKAMDIALKAVDETVDYIIYYAGETRDQHGEAASRTNLTLTYSQSTLLRQIKSKIEHDKLDTKIVLVVQTGRPNILSWEDENCDAVIQFWAPGSMGGPALLSLLYGEVSPSGKLPVTFPRNVGQIPISYSDLHSGRPYVPVDGIDDGEEWVAPDLLTNKTGSAKFLARYIDSKTSPLYVFGYGLSYTSFTYSASLAPTSASASSNDSVTIDVTVTNNDPSIAADEVVQIYVKTRVSNMATHKKRLRQFERVSFAKGDEPKSVQFILNVQEDFGYFDNSLKWTVEPGVYDIFVAKDSDDESTASIITLT